MANKDTQGTVRFVFTHYICFLHFLDAPSHLYKRVCPSVRPSVCPSVRPWVRGSVSIKEKRGLGASYVGYPALFTSTSLPFRPPSSKSCFCLFLLLRPHPSSSFFYHLLLSQTSELTPTPFSESSFSTPTPPLPPFVIAPRLISQRLFFSFKKFHGDASSSINLGFDIETS